MKSAGCSHASRGWGWPASSSESTHQQPQGENLYGSAKPCRLLHGCCAARVQRTLHSQLRCDSSSRMRCFHLGTPVESGRKVRSSRGWKGGCTSTAAHTSSPVPLCAGSEGGGVCHRPNGRRQQCSGPCTPASHPPASAVMQAQTAPCSHLCRTGGGRRRCGCSLHSACRWQTGSHVHFFSGRPSPSPSATLPPAALTADRVAGAAAPLALTVRPVFPCDLQAQDEA